MVPECVVVVLSPARNGSWNWLRTSLIVSLRLAIAVFALLSRVSIIDIHDQSVKTQRVRGQSTV